MSVSDYHLLLYVVIVISALDAKSAVSSIWNVPYKERPKRREWLEQNCSRFRSYSDVCVIVKIVCCMFIECSNEEKKTAYNKNKKTKKTKNNRTLKPWSFIKKWALKNNVALNWMKSVLRVMHSTLKSVFGRHTNTGMPSKDNYSNVLHMSEMYTRRQAWDNVTRGECNRILVTGGTEFDVVHCKNLRKEKWKSEEEKTGVRFDSDPLSLLVQFLAEGYAENLYERFGTQYALCHSTPRTFARHDFSALSTFAEVDSVKVLALEVIHLNSFCLIGMCIPLAQDQFLCLRKLQKRTELFVC